MTKYQYYSEVYDTIEEALEKALEFIDDEILITMWNDYCYDILEFSAVIYEMRDFNDYCCDMSPSDIVKKTALNFDINDGYFTDGKHGFRSVPCPRMLISYFDLSCWLSDKIDFYDFKEFSKIEEIDNTDNE